MTDKSPEDTATPQVCLHLPLGPGDDSCYEYSDKSSKRIVFRKAHPTYKKLKSAMKPLGINIDYIDTESDLIEIVMTFVGHFSNHGITIVTTLYRKLLEDRINKSRELGDDKEVKRLMGLLRMRIALWERLL